MSKKKIALILFCCAWGISCSKPRNDLGPDYDAILGSWGTMIQDELVQFEVKKNGVMELKQSIDRKFKIRAIKYQSSKIDPTNFPSGFVGTKYSDKFDHYFSVSLNDLKDTIEISNGEGLFSLTR